MQRNIISTEADFYEFPNEELLFKSFFNFDERKKKIIQKLEKVQRKYSIKELEIPTTLVKINDNFTGLSIKKIKGNNLSLVLSNDKISISQKINYLKQVGKVLDNLSRLRKKYNYNNFFLNDIHEDNCIIDNNNKIHIIDLDSSVFSKKDWFQSKYLCHVRNSKLKKYNDFGINQDTDYYCYCIMILNFLFQRKIQNLSYEEFDQYLDYLDKIRFDYSLINCFSKLYINVSNENPYKSLDTIDSNVYLANYYNFKTNQKTYKFSAKYF